MTVVAVYPDEDLSHREERWQVGLLTLRAWLAENPEVGLPPQDLRLPDGFRLGQWVLHQQQRREQGLLPEDRVAVLEALPGWRWARSQSDRWQAAFEDLRDEARRTGSAMVRPGTVGERSGRDVAAWAHAQRAAHVEGRLASERVALLAALPGWEWARPRDARWNAGLKALKRFVEEHGHASPGSTVRLPSGEPVGAWVGSQRALWRAGRMPEDRVAALEALPGWTWTPTG